MSQRIQLRRDTAANWTSASPVLAQGEPATETDTGKWKVGDGSTAWTSLPYAFSRIFTSAALGNGSSKTLTVTHNLNSQLPLVQVWNVSGGTPVRVECAVTAPTVNTVQLQFGTAPAASSLKCTVVG